MFKATADLSVLRPGLLGGVYPEADPDRTSAKMPFFSLLPGAKALRQISVRHMAAQCRNLQNHFESLDSNALREALSTQKQMLRQYGFTTQLIIKTLALIGEYATRVLGMRPFNSQVMCAYAVLSGNVAEMATGEGKTLALALAAATAGLAGIPVHVITVNEYLVQRDAQSLLPLYRALGLTCAFAIQEMAVEQRRSAYAKDITYVTNKQVAFDYLRDQLIIGNRNNRTHGGFEPFRPHGPPDKNLLLRGLCFAVIDEADSVLIDDAGTPLILTKAMQQTTDTDLFLNAYEATSAFSKPGDFQLDRGQKQVMVTPAGYQKINVIIQRLNLSGFKSQQFRQLCTKALEARHLFSRDIDYLVDQNKIQIIDGNIGRTMPDRSWRQGLQQMLEIKESCPLTQDRQVLGHLTYQSFFRRYLRIGGVSGTVFEAANELSNVYALDMVKIPLHKKNRRRWLGTRIFRTRDEKWNHIIAQTQKALYQGRPVLIGTVSVEESETAGRYFKQAGINHQILNARQNAREAEIIARAGRKDTVTIATNMAGRGTDIKLGPKVADAGGLHLIAACVNSLKRVDRQLYGRCARQGDPGSYQVCVCLADDFFQSMKNHKPAMSLIIFLLNFFAGTHRPVQFFIHAVQRRNESRKKTERSILLDQEKCYNQLLAFSRHSKQDL